MARVSHPNVMTIFDVGELADGRVYLAMELVDGVSLRVALARPHSLTEKLDFFLQAGRGLAAAHDAGLVHRDFKPDNVLVGRDGRVRVTDFGLARGALDTQGEAPLTMASGRALTATGALLGTPAYMAPEQHIGVTATPRADQFAFGVALYEALVGARPFEGANYQALRDAKLQQERRPWPRSIAIPMELRVAVDRALSRAPESRHASMHPLLAILEKAGRKPEPTSTTPLAPPVRLPSSPAPALPLARPPQGTKTSKSVIRVLLVVVVALAAVHTAVNMASRAVDATSVPATPEEAARPVVPPFAPVVSPAARASVLPCPPGAASHLDGPSLACILPGGLPHGPSLFFDEDDKLRSQAVFDHGKRTGRAWELASDGRVTLVEDYDDGELDGVRLELHENGAVRTAAEYRRGQLHGVSRRWSEDGKLQTLTRYEMGREIQRKGF
jgi:serine/threonine protein kinase